MDETRDNQPVTFVEIAADGDVILVVGLEKVKLRVRSLFLKAASKPFSAMFGPGWKEGHNMLDRDGLVELPFPEDNAAALKLICAIIHHRNQKKSFKHLPQATLWELLLRRTSYACVNALKFAGGNWLQPRKFEASNLLLLTAAASLFRNAQAFKEITKAMILNHSSPYLALSCEEVEPTMPWTVISLLEEERSFARLKLAEILLEGINQRD
ncbi:hypothetical protein K469DRAFT_690264 [Zopfia rhizophila CBS 207.26]|uniref:BTB domain-containing protein n=1 Tax=Zopfia rhizophila CBS 207.26 TaxID=1314779 RepID=A0A6A6DY17_9PEZI|nr:hypothetical protein K469DRAFT_690264 [Zopfia rhizophila CBS 207.26]